jgi:hypothetical protein
MAKITISDLPNTELDNFINDLNSGDLPFIFGGSSGSIYQFSNLGVQGLSFTTLASILHNLSDYNWG